MSDSPQAGGSAGLKAEVLGDVPGGDSWLLDPEKGWPKCDLCGRIMDKDDEKSRPGLFACSCSADGFTLSFPSCRSGHRYCAWDQLTDAMWQLGRADRL